MRIAIVNPVWSAEAATPSATLERFTTLTGWAEAIRGAGAGTVVVFQRFPERARVDRAGVGYEFVPGRCPTVAAAVAAFDPDVVHVNGLDHPRLTRALRRALGARAAIVVQDHGGFDPAALSAVRRLWFRYGLTAADALLVAAPRQIDLFRDNGITPESIVVRDVMEASTTLRIDRRIDAARLTMLWVGRLNANKDPLTVLAGFARFARARPDLDARLTYVYGSCELETQLRDAVRADAALADRVVLAGAVAHTALTDDYARAHLFVLGSHHEGSGYAVLEALACGVVPVVTDIPSFHALTAGGRVGALWKAGDAESLAAALERVASRPIEAERAACRALFDERFSWPAIGRRALSIYEELSRT